MSGKQVCRLLALAAAAVLVLVGCQTAGQEAYCEIAVEGRSSINIEPDMVEFSLRVSETAPTTGEAQGLANAKVSKILALLESFGVERKDITTNNLSFSTDYNWEDGKQEFVAERVSQQVSVSMYNLDSFPAMVDALGAQLTGITLNSVCFDRKNKAAFYEQARREAVEDAAAKARAYAEAGGLALGEPLSISEGSLSSYSNNRRYMDMRIKAEAPAPEAAYGSDVPAGEIVVQASINVVFKAY